MMRRETVWQLVGLACALAFAVGLTVVPVGGVTTFSGTKSVKGSATFSETQCAQTSFDATLTFTMRQPLIDVWGFKRFDDISLSDVTVAVEAPAGCDEGLEAIATTLSVEHPGCDREHWEGDPVGRADIDGFAVGCDGYMLFYSAQGDDGSATASMNHAGPDALPGSGLVRGDWCLDVEGYVSYNSASDVVTQTGEDLCLDLTSTAG